MRWTKTIDRGHYRMNGFYPVPVELRHCAEWKRWMIFVFAEYVEYFFSTIKFYWKKQKKSQKLNNIIINEKWLMKSDT